MSSAELNAAMLARDSSKVAELLSCGTINLSANAKGELLYRAVALDDLKLATVLLDAGAPANYRNSADRSVGENCLFNINSIPILELLVERGADFSVQSQNENVKGDVRKAMGVSHEPLRYLLLKGGVPIDDDEVAYYAAKSCRTLKVLLDRNFNVKDARSRGNETALHHVITRPFNLELIDMLVNVVNVDVDVVNSDMETCTHRAASHGIDEALRLFAQAGADIEMRDFYGQTALHIAAGQNYLQSVTMLLAYGADVHARDNEGRSVLQVALTPEFRSAVAFSPIIHTLLAAGADTDDLADSFTHLPLGVIDAELDAGRRRIGAVQLGIVRDRALQVCIGLQSLRLAALQTCEILAHSFGRVGACVAFHHWWRIATTVKHFRRSV